MRTPLRLSRWITALVIAALAWGGGHVTRGPVSALATSYNTITIDGDCSLFTADEKLTGNDGTQSWITWDASNIYVGWLGGGASAQKRIMAFDLDPGANDGSNINYSGVTFPAQGQPDYVAEVSNGTTYFATRTGGSLSTDTNPSGTSNSFSSNCGGSKFVELQLPRSLFSGGSVSDLAPTDGMGVYSYFDDPAGGSGSGYIYGGMPAGKISDGAVNQTASDEEYFPTTDTGRSPSTYGRLLFSVAGNIHWDGLFSDQSPFYFASSATSTTTTEPAQGGSLLVRFRSHHGDLTSLNLNWSDCAVNCGSFRNWIPMQIVGQDATGGYDIWQADASALLTSSATKYYRFQANQGNATTWYNATGATCGSGTQQSCVAPTSENFWVIPGFHTPSWSKSAIFYQVFPDRFRNGDPSNDIPVKFTPTTSTRQLDPTCPTSGWVYDANNTLCYKPSTTVAPPCPGGWNTDTTHSPNVCYDPNAAAQPTACPSGTYLYGGTCAYTHTSWNELPQPHSRGVDFFGGDLAGMTQEIDPYLKQTLGVNAIYLNPIFQSPSIHKYDTQDYFTVDPHFGSNTGSGAGSLTSLIGTAHTTSNFTGDQRMSIVLDGVFNHTGDWSCWFNRPQNACGGVSGAWQDPTNSPYAGWYKILPGFNQSTAPNNYCAWSGFGSLPQLNYSSAGVRNEIYRGGSSVMRTYLSAPYNVDGWRLDVADNYSNLDTASSPCQIGNGNHQIWQDIRSYLKGSQATANGLGQLGESLILGEYWQKPTDWLGGDQWDSVMNYNGFNTPVSCFFTGQGVHGETDPNACPGNVSNPSGLSSWLQGTLADNNRSSQLAMLNSLTTHDTSRFLYRACTAVGGTGSQCASSSSTPPAAYNKLMMAIEMQMTYVGMPSIYYGDEIGTTGGNDPDNRRTFDWNPANWNKSVLDLTRTLTHNRTAHQSWQDGSFMPLVVDNTKNVFVYGRLSLDPSSIGSAGGVTPSDAAVVAFNNNSSAETVTLDATQLDLVNGTTLTDLVGGGTASVSAGTITLNLPAYTGMVLTPTPVNLPAPTAPDAPTNLASTIASGQATLTWNAQGSGSPVIGYDVTASPSAAVGPVSCTGTASSSCTATVSGLDSTTSYAIHVSAYNEAGDGPAATLRTPSAPAITSQPSDVTVTVGKSFSLSAAARGNPTPTFMWYVSGSGTAGSFNAISGATSSTYSVSSASATDAGYYYAVATNSVDSATSNTAHVTVNAKQTPVITWSNPPDITYGTALSATQLNATTGVAGSFAYTPAAGTVLSAGNNQPLSVIFTPTDTSSYSAATAIVHINVLKAPLTGTADPKSTQYSDPLPDFTVSYSSFVNGDTRASLGGTLSCFTTAATNTAQRVVSPTGGYPVTCSGQTSPNYTITYHPGTLVVDVEDTIVKPAESNPAGIQVTRAGGSAPVMTFTAVVTEASDSSYGDITKASPVTFTLAPMGSGTTYTCTVPSKMGAIIKTVAATRTTPGSITLSCTFLAGVAVNLYDVTVQVHGKYYRGLAERALTVYDPTQAGVQSGGGLITNPITHATISFGFTALRKSGGGIVGQMFSVETDASGNQVAVIRGTSMSTLSVTKSAGGGYPETARIAGKMTLNGNGNYGYTLQAVDAAGTTRDADRYGTRVTEPGGAVVSNLSFNPQTLITDSSRQQIGNIFVRR